MFLDYPVVEQLFRVVVWVVIGIPVAILIFSLFATFLTVKLAALALMWGVTIALIGYLLGIPWSIWFRLRHGRWPQS